MKKLLAALFGSKNPNPDIEVLELARKTILNYNNLLAEYQNLADKYNQLDRELHKANNEIEQYIDMLDQIQAYYSTPLEIQDVIKPLTLADLN